MRNIRDTLNISLGRDKKIIVRREKDNEYKASKTFGNTTQEWYKYSISIRNTRNEPISLTVMEQFPVSNEKSISVEDRATIPQAVVDEETGAVRWTFDVKPNEIKKLSLNYSIKYPKDKRAY